MISKLKKDSFIQANYLPGPGFYQSDANSIQAKQIQILSKPGDGLGTQNRVDRFKQSSKDELGPGYYKIQDPWIDQQKKIGAKQQVKKSENQAKIIFHSIPSIPKSTNGYNELENGILLAQDTKDDKNIGPGEYEPNFEVKQKRSISYSIKPQRQNFSKKQEIDINHNVQKDDEILNFKYQNENEKNKKNQISKNLNQSQNQIKKKKQTFKEIFEEQMRSSENFRNMNLEQLVQKQKMMSRFHQGPDYVDREIYSCFKNQGYYKVNDIEGLGFDTKEERFNYKQQYKQITSETVGPGAYTLIEKKNAIQAKISQLPRSNSYIANDPSIPGVGQYNPKQKIQPNFKPSKSKFNSAFGCGTQRFMKNTEEKFGISCPAPGNYEAYDQFKQKKQKKIRSTTFHNGSNNYNQNQNQNQIQKQFPNGFQKGVNRALLNKNQNLAENLENQQADLGFDNPLQGIKNQDRISKIQQDKIYAEMQNKRKQRANSQFVSGTQRFKEFGENKGYNIGPGQYQNENYIKQGKKNEYQKIGFCKADRFQYPLHYEYEKRIGPGYYDYDVKHVKINTGANKQEFF